MKTGKTLVQLAQELERQKAAARDFVTAEQVEREMLLPASYRTIKTRTFNSRESAYAAAKLLGHTFADKTKGAWP